MMGEYRICSLTRLCVIMTSFVVTYAKHEHYAGWKSYYVEANTEEHLQKLNVISAQLGWDFLSPAHVAREAVVLVTPEQQEGFINNLNRLGIKYRIHVDDVKSALDHDELLNENGTKAGAREGSKFLTYRNYERWEKINAYLEYIARKYENFTNLMTAGNTSEGRPIRYLRISTTKFRNRTKPIIFIEGGMHGREWISPPTVTWAIMKLTEDITEPDLVRNYDWILMPVANPDGYVHTFSGKRFWRKNRSKKHPNDHFCPGVDVNRNFDIAWNTAATENFPCSSSFPGKKPFTEIEAQVIRDILKRRHPRIALYLSMHSYGSMVLYPWGHTTAQSHFFESLHTIGIAMADAIFNLNRPIFSRLMVGPTVKVLYKCSGTAADYAHQIGVPLVYSYELPGVTVSRMDTKEDFHGFHLAPQYIFDVCQATWTGIVEGARRAKIRFDKYN